MKKITLTPSQEAWLVANYADTYNADICKRLGLKLSTMHRLAAELGLKKSPELMRAAQAAATEKARIMLKGEGNKGRMNLAIYGKPFRFKKGETSRQRLGDEREDERMRKVHESRRQTIRMEKIRINWGLPQRTKMRLVNNPKQRWIRSYLHSKGYIIPCRRATTVYYDDATIRGEKAERTAKERGIEILPIDKYTQP